MRGMWHDRCPFVPPSSLFITSRAPCIINHIRRGEEYNLMSSQKTLTIGVTVNLEHYENLRLEVSGDVDSPEDAENLSQFLDSILGCFGKNDPATAERVNSYRRRVFPGSASAVAVASGTMEIPPPLTRDNLEQRPETGPVAPEIQLVSAEVPSMARGTVPAATCESCGTPVSPAEQKMSQLFASRTLCRVCMKNLQIETKAR